MELWKDIPDYEGIYQASTEGRIRTCDGKTTYSVRHGVRHWQQRIIKPKWQRRSNGRQDARVELWKDKEHKTCLVARLVAMTWVNGYTDGATVNHINGDSSDNRIANLEWVSRKENIQHGFRTGLYSNIQKKTRLVDIEEKQILTFESQSEASRFLHHADSYINDRIRKGHKTAYSSDGVEYLIQ